MVTADDSKTEIQLALFQLVCRVRMGMSRLSNLRFFSLPNEVPSQFVSSSHLPISHLNRLSHPDVQQID